MNVLIAIAAAALPLGLANEVWSQQKVSKDLHETVLERQELYFQLRENDDYSGSYEFLSDVEKRNISEDEYGRLWFRISEDFGKLVELENTVIAYLTDPEGVSDGLYAIIHYRAHYEAMPVFCGFVLWSLAGNPEVTREEVNIVAVDDPNEISLSQREEIYRKLSCK